MCIRLAALSPLYTTILQYLNFPPSLIVESAVAVPLPYLASPGSAKTALEKIRAAATPERVTGDFITTKLQIKGGTGAAIIPFLKKSDSLQPTDLRQTYTDASEIPLPGERRSLMQ
ncbi:DUF5343 domain-containing protein [Rhodopseudomonas sp. G2_2311]|uniref:DUF5343 domain-containing protein n=1 Tax=Rhodopseudomonas sp. G2_2311 TaxID=3114287 RepID=UPI0039C5B0F3